MLVFNAALFAVAFGAAEATATQQSHVGPKDIAGQPIPISGSAVNILAGLGTCHSTKARPENAEELQLALSSIWSDRDPTHYYDNIRKQICHGIAPEPLIEILGSSPSPDAIQAVLQPTPGPNSYNNTNKAPSKDIYNGACGDNVTYSLPEAQLRAAIYIPPSFQWGNKPPVILIPGTNLYAGECYGDTILELINGTAYADPVLVNIPDTLHGDLQFDAEYVSYAIRYIYDVTNNTQVAVVAASGGALVTQWALTFWTCTQNMVKNFFAISADFHGTTLGNTICGSSGNGAPGTAACTPANTQQEYNSLFVNALRQHGGGNATVPTTTIWTANYDELIQPQQGNNASARLDDKNKPVTNVEVQRVCPSGSPASGHYGHADMLYNAVTGALLQQVLMTGVPGNVSALDLTEICPLFWAEGLSFFDVLGSIITITGSVVRGLTYQPKVTAEPSLQSYAK
ncbi:alpha/beta-hydrolase [Thozetella sp. PMI_491]|nr:alpha/beta-hydrolase [Thozetella sp. PMI_491]